MVDYCVNCRWQTEEMSSDFSLFITELMVEDKQNEISMKNQWSKDKMQNYSFTIYCLVHVHFYSKSFDMID